MQLSFAKCLNEAQRTCVRFNANMAPGIVLTRRRTWRHDSLLSEIACHSIAKNTLIDESVGPNPGARGGGDVRAPERITMKRIIGFACISTIAIACGAAPSDAGPEPAGDLTSTTESKAETSAIDGANPSSQPSAAAPDVPEAIESEEAVLRKVSAGDVAAGIRLLEQYEQRGVSSSELTAAKRLLEQCGRGRVSRDTPSGSALAAPEQGQSNAAPLTDDRQDCIQNCALSFYVCVAMTVTCGPWAPFCLAGCETSILICHDSCPPGNPGDPPPPLPPPPPPPPPDCQVCCDLDSDGNCRHCIAPPQVCP